MIKISLANSIALLAVTAPVVAQTTAAPATAPAELTAAESATLKKCKAMTIGQQGQSSKCSKVMVKAGLGDPAKARGSAGADPER